MTMPLNAVLSRTPIDVEQAQPDDQPEDDDEVQPRMQRIDQRGRKLARVVDATSTRRA